MKEKKEALCIVAHPDDETIWMGGTILKNKDFNWTIISLCRKDDPDRAPKFKKACEFYKANSLIFTHGENGEYGHLRHKEIHKAVKKMIKSKELKAKQMYYFSYKNKNSKIPYPNPSSDLISN